MRRKIIIILGIIGTILIVSISAWSMSGKEKQSTTTDKNGEATNEPSVRTLTSTEALETVVGDNSVSGAKYFTDNTWLVGVTSANGSGETYTIVARLTDGKWHTVDVGSFIDTELLLLDGVPPDVIAYLEEIQ